MIRKNKERRSANVSLAVILLGFSGVVIPFMANFDMIKGGYASIVIGAIVGITAFLIFLMFNSRARVMENMFSDSNLLAHWQYSQEFWQEETREDIKDTGVAKIIGFVLGGIFLLIGIVVLAADPDDNGAFFLIMLGVAVFFVIVGFVAAAANKRKLQSALPEALIAREGVYFKGELYTWNQPVVSYLECVAADPAAPNKILFVFRQLGGRAGHYHQHFVSIPVPPGQETSANQIIQFFNMPMTQEMYKKIMHAAAE